jgi:hypothetical protein
VVVGFSLPIPQNLMEHDCIPSDFTDGVYLVLMTL